jgi:hypothetical protein
MNTPHIGITYSQRNGLRRYRENQRAIRYVAPMHRRSADVPPPAPTWLAWTAMVALSIVLTLAAWSFAEYLLPMLWRLP